MFVQVILNLIEQLLAGLDIFIVMAFVEGEEAQDLILKLGGHDCCVIIYLIINFDCGRIIPSGAGNPTAPSSRTGRSSRGRRCFPT